MVPASHQRVWAGAESSARPSSLAALRKLRDQAGATMFYGHDPAQWATTPRAPMPVV